MGLNDLIVSMNSHFVDTEKFAETVTWAPLGDWGSTETIDCNVDRASLPGTNETPGDGPTNNTPAGTRIRESLVLTIPMSYLTSVPAIQRIQNSQIIDQFKLSDGTVWGAKRIVGEDNGMFDLLCTRIKGVVIKKAVRSG